MSDTTTMPSSEERIIQMIIDRLDRIDDSIDKIHSRLNQHPPCPSPGACVPLTQQLTATSARLERLELRILAVEKWQNKVIGIGSALIVLVTLFGPSIRRIMGLD